MIAKAIGADSNHCHLIGVNPDIDVTNDLKKREMESFSDYLLNNMQCS